MSILVYQVQLTEPPPCLRPVLLGQCSPVLQQPPRLPHRGASPAPAGVTCNQGSGL
ncbi:hypothetical protein JYU34_009958 [Plutella xylostella]|uniref:Uncharacterized protein n=1 Tax=Plutella xylostella TaxID=51655 RepID=A0ABQ7QKV2_PLUXY|nr:hypothetical protein JYU34_009958 [Plutella xylostella]